MHETKTETLKSVALFVLLIAALALPAILIGPDPAGAKQAGPLCFSAQLWSADDRDRPCYSIERPQEDTSGTLTIRHTRKVSYRCDIPNPDGRSRFVVRCRAIPIPR